MEERQRELHKKGGRLQGKEVSVSYTRKRGDCKGKRST